jgi:adenosylcobinamide-phosphate synthase
VDRFAILALALILDAVVGDPERLWRSIPHPVVLFGNLIGALDRQLNRAEHSAQQRKYLGVVAILVLVAAAALVGWGLEVIFALLPFGWIGTVIVTAVMLAGRGLYDHVAAVAEAFRNNGLDAARSAISKIVGRDPDSLDEAATGRAAVESVSENFSDGLVAPALWFALLGLPGLLAYKAINTADSMIGHRSERYRDFGWAAARLDDLVNWPAARLSGLLVACAAPLVGGSIEKSVKVMFADAPKHRSPNAGWPEAAMAGALDVALVGPRHYAGILFEDDFMNAAGDTATIGDIDRALRIYAGAWAFVLLLAVAATLI